MRVLFDISVLGEALYNLQARTGVSRVVDNLRRALAQEGEIELFCCAFHSLLDHTRVLAGLDSQPCLQGVSLHPRHQSLSSLVVKAAGYCYPHQMSSPRLRFATRLLNGAMRGAEFLLGGVESKDLEGFDVLHTTFFPVPLSLRGQQAFSRFIMVHDLIPLLFPQYCSEAQKKFCRELVDCIDKDDWVFVNSESTKSDLCENIKIEPNRVIVTPLAASYLFSKSHDEYAKIKIKEKYNIPNCQYVLSVCTIEPRKNICTLIESYVDLIELQHIKDMCLVLVGPSGWGDNRVGRLIDNAKKKNIKIVTTGYVDDEDLSVLYSGAMMFVYPSLYEGFGLPPLEAMQCGVPVITSNVSSLPEVVGHAGIMVDPLDKDAICQAMWDVYSQPTLREALSRKSIERAEIFNWQRTARLTLNGYRLATRNPL